MLFAFFLIVPFLVRTQQVEYCNAKAHCLDGYHFCEKPDPPECYTDEVKNSLTDSEWLQLCGSRTWSTWSEWFCSEDKTQPSTHSLMRMRKCQYCWGKDCRYSDIEVEHSAVSCKGPTTSEKPFLETSEGTSVLVFSVVAVWTLALVVCIYSAHVCTNCLFRAPMRDSDLESVLRKDVRMYDDYDDAQSSWHSQSQITDISARSRPVIMSSPHPLKMKLPPENIPISPRDGGGKTGDAKPLPQGFGWIWWGSWKEAHSPKEVAYILVMRTGEEFRNMEERRLGFMQFGMLLYVAITSCTNGILYCRTMI